MIYALMWWFVELMSAGILNGRYFYPVILYGSYRFIYFPSFPWGTVLVLCLSDMVWTGQWGALLIASFFTFLCAKIASVVFDTSLLIPYILVSTIFLGSYFVLKTMILGCFCGIYSTGTVIFGNVISGTIMVALKYRKKHAGQSLFTKK